MFLYIAKSEPHHRRHTAFMQSASLPVSAALFRSVSKGVMLRSNGKCLNWSEVRLMMASGWLISDQTEPQNDRQVLQENSGATFPFQACGSQAQ